MVSYPALALEDLGVAEDAVERGAQLVAHIGQEDALGLIGRLGRIAGHRQLGGSFGDQLLEAIAVLAQLFVQWALSNEIAAWPASNSSTVSVFGVNAPAIRLFSRYRMPTCWVWRPIGRPSIERGRCHAMYRRA